MRPSHILLRSTTPCPNKDSPALKSTRPAVPIQKKLSPAPFNSMASPMTDNPAPTKSKPPASPACAASWGHSESQGCFFGSKEVDASRPMSGDFKP